MLRILKQFLLLDFWKGFALGFRYLVAPKATLNYPHEKGHYHLVFVVNMR